MLIRFKTGGVALICCLIASPVFAEGWNSSVVFSAGYAKEQGACSAPLYVDYVTGGTCSEKHSVFRFAYDYQFNRVLGFEISYGDLAKAEGNGTTVPGLSGYPGAWKMKSHGWAIAATGTVPMGGGLSLKGKIGGVRAEFDEDLTFYCDTCPDGVGEHHIREQYRILSIKNNLTYGLGLQYDFNKTYAIRAQYENFGKYKLYTDLPPGTGTTITVSIAQVSAGFVFKF